APIEDPVSLLHNPQLEARGFLRPAETGDCLPVRSPGLPFTGVPEPETPNRPPRLGEHNAEVLGGLLGLSEPEIEALRTAGAL
ncbi:MAG TPA: CoA transferase, partial [Dehalococcoidia bacterium]|nr:CoA transferase [Dehalococcoidia bacterium]